MEALLIDLGNTNIKLAYAQDSKIIHHAQIPTTKSLKTSDLTFALENLAQQKPDFALICSVVPQLNDTIVSTIKSCFSCAHFFVPTMWPIPLNSAYKTPKTLGIDRLLAAYAASQIYPEYQVKYIVDLGTATTIDCVINDTFMGGLILPGPTTALKSLYEKTAQLPDLKFPTNLESFKLGQSTIECIEQGIFFSTIAQIEGLLARLKNLYPGSNITIGTGGLAQILANHTDIFQALNENLVLSGLAILSQHKPKNIAI